MTSPLPPRPRSLGRPSPACSREGATIGQVVVEIYRVFPNDSDVGRTSGAPVFSTAQVPTRVNSPSDVALDSRDFSSGSLSFQTQALGTFTANNSVQPGGIHPLPGQTTGGNGPVTGSEVKFSVNFTTPFNLAADQYFFVPQVEVTEADGNFFWLSAARPIVPPGTPFPRASPIFRVGHEMQCWTLTGCGSAPTSLAPLRQRVQRLTRPFRSTA